MDQLWPISVKGLVIRGHDVLLMQNDRNEWELPGGHVEEGESPAEALVREIREETGLTVEPGHLLGADFYTPTADSKTLLLLFYLVQETDANRAVELSQEHEAILWASIDHLPDSLPPVYQKVVQGAWASLSHRVLHQLGMRLETDGSKRLQRLYTSFAAPTVAVQASRENGAPSRASSIRQLHEQFLQGQKSPVAVVEEQIAWAQRWQSRTPIFIELRAEPALAAAQAAEARYRAGKPLSVMDGMVVGLKDLIDVEGQRTTAASGVRREPEARADAEIAGMLRRAGINLELGKLNLHEFAYGPTGDSSYFGAVANPYDLTRMTGGSSSGSGALVAAGIAKAALGTDTGGSVRIPAALMGISGLKPTYGRISTKGVIPLSWSLDHIGPMARSVSDVRELWQIMTGAAGQAEFPRHPVIFWPNDGQTDCYEQGLQHYVESAIAALLEGLGAQVERGPLIDLEKVRLAQYIMLGSEALAYHWPQLERSRDQYQEDVSLRLVRGGAHLAAEYIAAQQYREESWRQWDAWMSRYDAVILPTVPIVAPPLYTKTVRSPEGGQEDVRGVLTRLTSPFNFLGVPALSIPWGFYENLPVGLQLVGRRGRDEALLALGEAIQGQFPDSLPPSPVIA